MLADRVIILVSFIALILIISVATKRWARTRLNRLQAQSSTRLWQALGVEPDGRPTVVTFSTPSCAVCRSAQLPALQALEQGFGSQLVRIIKVNAAEHPEIANAFGVLTVPTTIIMTTDGRVAAANNGFAPADRLSLQVQSAAASG